MINQVVLAGKLIQDPTILELGKQKCVELRLEIERVTRWKEKAETCAVVVRSWHETTIANVTRYLSKGRSALVHGHLRGGDGGLFVVGDSIEFMEDRLNTRAMEPGAFVTSKVPVMAT